MGGLAMAELTRILQVVADWANLFAGVCLFIAFSLICMTFTFKIIPVEEFIPGDARFDLMTLTMKAEGLLFALAGICLTKQFSLIVQAGGPSFLVSSAISQTIITFGGLFFYVSGFGNPAGIISLKYVLPVDPNLCTAKDPCTWTVNFASVAPFYGIACFMIATLSNQLGIMSAPAGDLKTALTSFFAGAWIIGVFGLWGPVFAGGFKSHSDYEPIASGGIFLPGVLAAPINSWTWIHIWQAIGAGFLTYGAATFIKMDVAWKLEPPSPSESELVDNEVELSQCS